MLKVENISKQFNRKVVLDDVSAQFIPGKVNGILGPNGAGKTTLIRIINQIIDPDKGKITWKDKRVGRDLLKNIGYLPEERGLYLNMTVKEHLRFAGMLKGMSNLAIAEQTDYWLDKFDIQDWRYKRIESLSKGMAQKIQFAVAVLHQPDIIILDEPFSGFDPVNIQLIRKSIRELKEEGKTILLSTHNMNSVEELCDRVLLFHQSKKVLEGSVAEIKQEGKSDVLAIQFQGNLMAFVNSLWTGYDFIDKKILADDRFVARVHALHGNELKDLVTAVKDTVKIEGVWEEAPSMETIFIQKTQAEQQA